jgi:8-amino-7-oxononanoate synthase
MPTSFSNHLNKKLTERKDQHLYRTRKLLQSPQQVHADIDDQAVISFCSNDYLGLANHESVKQAAIESIQTDGFGGGASHLVNGHHQQHHLLEQELAAFLDVEACLLFSTGYMANVAVLATLAGKNDRILMDKLTHASLIDGAMLSAAKFQRFLHLDYQSLERQLKKTGYERTFVVTDGLFSMDGDIANISELRRLCQQYNAILIVDDAHGFGTIGTGGRGCVEHFSKSMKLEKDNTQLQAQDLIQIGTLGKAFGSSGAFVAGSQAVIDYLVQFGRPYIYTTAMPPSTAAASRQALSLLAKADSERLHLDALIVRFRSECKKMGYQLWPSFTPIQPIVLGSSERAMACSEFLRQRGLLVTAIRPPTVPNGSARLRVTLSAQHSFEDLECLLAALKAYSSL